jgi:hypothetical protein
MPLASRVHQAIPLTIAPLAIVIQMPKKNFGQTSSMEKLVRLLACIPKVALVDTQLDG